MPYLTPDADTTATICRRIYIPDNDGYRQAVSGALLELTYASNWEQLSGIDGDTAASRMLEMVIAFFADEDCQFGGGGSVEYAEVCDEKPKGTHGGSFTSGAWRTRTLNTVVVPASWLSLALDVVTLQAGDYVVVSEATCESVRGNRSRLVEDVSGLVVGESLSGDAFAGDQHLSIAVSRITVSGTMSYRLEHRCRTTVVNFGFGRAANIDDLPEKYSRLRIWKI